MLFSSVTFLYYFMGAALLCCLFAPQRLKNLALLLFSLLFYAWGEPKYVVLMVLMTALAYFEGLVIEKKRGEDGLKKLVGFFVFIDFIPLLIFKYYDFFAGSFASALGVKPALLKLALPIGISFYSFQLVSYVIDVFRGTKANRSLIALAAYISCFPQLIAGPIVRYKDIEPRLSERKAGINDIGEGLSRFVIGLSKKVILANTLGEFCDIYKACGEKSLAFSWAYAIALGLHIYFDFSGYSDMAIGLGKLLGFDFLENFDYPFISCSITEFWRRWHISLGSWFRDYVYIPLGGSRVGPARAMLNIFIVWGLTGLWHGAAWNFVLWGLWFAVLLVIEKYGLGKLIEKSKPLGHIYTLFFVFMSFVIFNADGLSGAVSGLKALFPFGGLDFINNTSAYYISSYLPLIIIAAIGSTPLIRDTVRRLAANERAGAIIAVAEPLVIAALFVICTAFLVSGSFNPFLYFRF